MRVFDSAVSASMGTPMSGGNVCTTVQTPDKSGWPSDSVCRRRCARDIRRRMGEPLRIGGKRAGNQRNNDGDCARNIDVHLTAVKPCGVGPIAASCRRRRWWGQAWQFSPGVLRDYMHPTNRLAVVLLINAALAAWCSAGFGRPLDYRYEQARCLLQNLVRNGRNPGARRVQSQCGGRTLQQTQTQNGAEQPLSTEFEVASIKLNPSSRGDTGL
jgi:hypothetical protein